MRLVLIFCTLIALCQPGIAAAKGADAFPLHESIAANPQTHTAIPGSRPVLHETRPGYDEGWTMPRTSVIIDVGHGGIDGGAFYGDTLEKDINLAIAEKLYLLLRSQGIPAVMNRTGDYALSDDNRWHQTSSRHRRDLSQRRQLTEEINSEILVSLHVNSVKNKTKRGPLVLHQAQGESALLAFCLQNALNRQQQTFRIAREGEPFYLLRRVDQPSVIVEMGFISNAEDRSMLTDPRRQLEIAEAIASGIWQYKWIAH